MALADIDDWLCDSKCSIYFDWDFFLEMVDLLWVRASDLVNLKELLWDFFEDCRDMEFYINFGFNIGVML